MIDLQIKLICECCDKVHDLPRTSEIPDNVNVLKCNYCIECEDKKDDYYNEWYVEESELPIVVDPNQLSLFS